MSDQTAFEREVDEDVRQDQLTQLWNAYGAWLIGGIVGAIGVSALVLVYQNWMQGEREAASDAFTAALTQAQEAAPEQGLAAIRAAGEAAPAGYRLLAQFEEAELLADQDNLDGAVAVYDAIARDGDQEQVFRSLAALKASYLLADTAEPSALLARLTPQRDAANPWNAFVRELEGLAHLRAGDQAAALSVFQALADDLETPAGLRARAGQMREFLAGGTQTAAAEAAVVNEGTGTQMTGGAAEGNDP